MNKLKIENPVIVEMLDVSTGHVTRDDAILLDIQCRHNPIIAHKYPEGYFVIIPEKHDHIDAEMIKYGYSDAFVSLVELCQVENYDAMRLDCDGAKYNEFPRFDW